VPQEGLELLKLHIQGASLAETDLGMENLTKTWGNNTKVKKVTKRKRYFFMIFILKES